ncbi:phosphorothioated DNA-binding restriction endonuclease [Blastococcus sp. SYSU D00669]
MATADFIAREALDRLASLRQHERNGRRAPHKPLLLLLALSRLASSGSSATPWSVAEQQLAALIDEFGPPSKTGSAQSAAYPFTHLRSDAVWVLDRDVPMDNVRPLREGVTGRLEHSLEEMLLRRPKAIPVVARGLVDSHFPATVAPDVLSALGFDPEEPVAPATPLDPGQRKRSATWRAEVIEAWDRQCAFCGFDGQAGGVPVGLEAAHVRWFALDGPDSLDNGLALCMLHHKLFDRGMLGLDDEVSVVVSRRFSARTPHGRAVYDLHGHRLAARPGTPLPALPHVRWHQEQVFQGTPLSA